MIREEDRHRPRVHLKPEGGEGLPLTGEEQRRLAELTNQLWFRRAILSARGASGFWCYQGTYCLDSAYSRVYGWEPLVEYVRALADKYGVPQPTW